MLARVASLTGSIELASAMPLTNCLACGKEVSIQAAFCPNCGHPIKELADRKKLKNIGLSCLGLVIIVGVGILHEVTKKLLSKIHKKIYVLQIGDSA
jgi:predicted RNA-binding Zn-ribbon protein involved in translation (DUF1610 family)